MIETVAAVLTLGFPIGLLFWTITH